MNTIVLDGHQLSLSGLILHCSTIPFLGQKRMVIVEGLLSRFETKRKESKSEGEDWQAIADYVDEMPSTTVLVLLDGPVSKANPLLKKIITKALVEEFPQLKGARLQQWIQTRVHSQGSSISPKASELLATFSGENLWIVANETDKLLTYTDGRRIEEKDIQLLTSYSREANVFAMTDALIEKRPAVAIKLLHQLMNEGAAVTYLLFMITNQVRLMLRAKDLVTQRMPAADIAAHLGLSPKYPMDKLLRQSASYADCRLLEVYQKLLDTDVSIKTGKQKDSLALDLLVAELSY